LIERWYNYNNTIKQRLAAASWDKTVWGGACKACSTNLDS